MYARVMVIDDEVEAGELIAHLLTAQHIEVEVFQDAALALERLAHESFDVVLTDLLMPAMHGFELCERIIGTRPDVPIIVITGDSKIEIAVEAMRAGAFDFLTKPIEKQVLLVAVERAIQRRRLGRELTTLQVVSAQPDGPRGALGRSQAMRRAFLLAARVAPSEASVLIHGETGTGKELVARSIHELSPRKGGPFVAINCAAMQPALLESELFGHVRGAFTDARDTRKGLFLEASGGTLFLDEIGEMPLELQPKLLRVLQERTVRAIGSNDEAPFDTRILAATNRVLEDEVFEGRFREDLYYRLNVVRIDVAPLRERDGDVPVLARHFLQLFAEGAGRPAPTLSPAAIEKLVAYDWPGNVRELENSMERAIALASGDVLDAADLPEKIQRFVPRTFTVRAETEEELVPIAQIEQRYILRVIGLVGGNKSRAAQMLGIDRRTLYRKLEAWKAAGDARQP